MSAARELAMFGCEVRDIEAILTHHVGPEKPFRTPEGYAVNVLSDVQELINLGENERARQLVNVAKWILLRRDDEARKAERR